jgi:type III pantothenate kinase
VSDGALRDAGEALHVDAAQQAFGTLAEALPERADRVVVANVAGEVMASRLVTFSMERWGVEPEFVEPAEARWGVTCGYRDPASLGADRWAAVVAVRRLTSGAACVIDAGTAVTLDVVDGAGRHLGGLILAGPRIIAAALHRETQGIGATQGVRRVPKGIELLGRSTDEAVAHGAMLGLAGAIERALAAVAEAMGAAPSVYLTGGDGELLATWLETRPQYRANLVLEGLAFMAAD